ncbi:MAG: tetratricopeptide repeat protein [Deltaproteobacteria bacterium]|nr:tetratricopeptide repeat protein [Deltaproteobacteria bacterium]
MMKFVKRLMSFASEDSYSKAMELYNSHMYSEAIELFENTLKKKPSPGSVHHNLARVYCGQAHRNLGILLFATGNYSDALEQFRAALKYNREHVELSSLIGVCLNNLGDFAGAVEMFNNILEIDSSHLPIKLKLGVALHNLGMWEKAAKIFEDILRENPNFADVYFRLGLTLLGQGKPSEAGNAFREALRINPEYTEAQKKLAITEAYLSHFDEALEQIQTVIERFPDYADMHYFSGIVYSRLDDLDAAVNALGRALQINPSYLDARIKLGVFLCQRGNLSEGLKEFEAASRLDPESESLQTAVDIVKEMINAPLPSSDALSKAVGQLFGKDKTIGETIEYFFRDIKINPDFSDIHLIIEHLSDKDTSLCEMLIPIVKDCIDENPRYPDLHNTLGSILMKLNRTEEAVEEFRKSVNINPKYINARINLFMALKEKGEFQEALDQGESIIREGVSFPDIFCAIGEVCFSMSRYEDALRYAQKASELNSRYGKASFLRAQIYRKQGNIHAAENELKKCLKSDLPTELLNKVKEQLNDAN